MSLYKRITLFLLILSLIISASPATAQNEATSSEESGALELSQKNYDENLQFLTSLGIYTFSEEKMDGNVSRGMFAKMVTDLLSIDSMGDATAYFNDVDSNYEYSGEIGTVASLKIMNGVGGGNFLPEQSITYLQAVKTIVSALGYTPAAEVTGGYTDGYMRCAYEIGILENSPYDYDAPLTFEKAANLIKLAADAEIYDIIAIKGNDAYYTSIEGHTVLSFYHGVYISEGIMTDNGITAINGKTQTGINGSIIGKRRLTGTDEWERDFLGYFVEYYYCADDNELLYVYERKGRNDIVSIKAKDIMTDAPEFSKTCLVTDIDGKKRKYKIDLYANLIYNGGLDETFKADTLKIKDGTLTLIDADRDNDYETILAEEYVDIILGNCNEGNESITAAYSTAEYASIKYGEYESAIFQDVSGNRIKPEELAAESVISVFKSKNKEKIRFVVSDVRAEIIADSVETDSDGNTVVYYNEESYEFSSTYKTLMKSKPAVYKKPEAGSSYQLFLNYEGNIAMLVETKGKLQYAYMMDIYRGSRYVEVMLHLESDDTAYVPVSKKLTLDGVKNKTGDDIFSVDALFDSVTGDFKPQLVMVRINAKGELKELDIATDSSDSAFGFDLENFSLDFISTLGYSPKSINGVRTYNGAQIISSDAKIFVVRNSKTTMETSEDDSVRVIDYKTAAQRYGSHYLKLYDADESWSAAAVVISEPLDYSSRLFIVTESYMQLNEEDEYMQAINGWYAQDFRSLIESREGALTNAVKTRYPGSDGTINVGDAFEITFDVDEKLIKARLIYSPQRDTSADYCFFDMNGNTVINDDNTMYILGYPCFVGTDRIGTYSKANKSYTSVNGQLTETEEKYWTTILSSATSTLSVFEFDCSTKELKVISAADIPSAAQLSARGYENFNPDTKVLLKRVNGTVYDILVVTNMTVNYR